MNPDYEAALTFTLSEATRLIGQLRREQLQTREMALTIRFNDFTEVGGGHRFHEPQFQNTVINTVLKTIFRQIMGDQAKPVRQIRIAFWNLARLDTQPTLWGRTHAERWGALDDAAHVLNGRFGPTALMTGAQLALRAMEEFKNPKAKMSIRATTRNGEKTLGHWTPTRWRTRGDLGKTAGEGQQTITVPALILVERGFRDAQDVRLRERAGEHFWRLQLLWLRTVAVRKF